MGEDIFDVLNAESESVISKMSEVKKFKNEIKAREDKIKNFWQGGALEVLKQPIQVVKNVFESLRLKRIERKFNNICHSSIERDVSPEDVLSKSITRYVIYHERPARVRSYIKSLKGKI